MPVKKPVLMTVDDDSGVLRAIARDLRRQYGDRFRIVRAESGDQAIESLKKLRLTDEPVALLLADQRMPGLTGVEFLEQGLDLYPGTKRALLTAYADTDAAIKAINDADIDYYLLKLWDPPEERLYPVLDDLLQDWQATYTPTFEGIRVIGHQWSALSHEIRDFLARNQVPYQWSDIELDAEAQGLVELAGVESPTYPVVILPEGEVMEAPSTADVAAKCGLKSMPKAPFYEVVVVGAGPAGLAAAVYAATEGLKTVIVEREAPGGQAGMSSRIENYLGFPTGVSGAELARRAVTQAKRFGVEFLTADEATDLTVQDGYFATSLKAGSHLISRSVVLATGVSYRRLKATGVEELTGSGIYYGAAMTEAAAVKGEDIFIVGGANSAAQASVFFSGYAKSVTMLVRGTSLADSMSQYLIDRIETTENIHVRFGTQVQAVEGDGRLESLTLVDRDTEETETVPAAAMFIFIGAVPPTEWLGETILLDERGFVLTGTDVARDERSKTQWNIGREPLALETSVPGIFAAGDVRHGSGKHVATAVGEGSKAVMSIWEYREHAGI